MRRINATQASKCKPITFEKDGKTDKIVVFEDFLKQFGWRDITFAIEIGQKITNTGNMEFADIMFGLVGFIAMFLVFLAVRGVYHLILKLIKYWRKSKQGKFQTTKPTEE